MNKSTTNTLSLWSLTTLVVGAMIGAGIFSLPAAFGRATGGLGAIIAWVIAGGGMLMLAFVFQNLAQRKPELNAGVFSYAKAGFGEYPGFISALGFWAGTCIGNVSYFILIKSTLGAFSLHLAKVIRCWQSLSHQLFYGLFISWYCGVLKKRPLSIPWPPVPRSSLFLYLSPF